MDRTVELLCAAADAMDDYTDPFHQSFLVEHRVTFDEVMTLSELLAIGTHLVAWGLEHPREARAALDGACLVAVGNAIERLLPRSTRS